MTPKERIAWRMYALSNKRHGTTHTPEWVLHKAVEFAVEHLTIARMLRIIEEMRELLR